MRSHLVQFHGEEKQFQCQLCDKKFLYAYQLRVHVNSHRDKASIVIDENVEHEGKDDFVQTLFQCDQCDVMFDSYKNLQLHCAQHAQGGQDTLIVRVDDAMRPLVEDKVGGQEVVVQVAEDEAALTQDVAIDAGSMQQYVIVYDGETLAQQADLNKA